MGLNRGIPSRTADCVACFEPTLAPEVPRNGVKQLPISWGVNQPPPKVKTPQNRRLI